MIYIDNAATSRRKSIKVIISSAKETAFSANAGRGGHRAGMKTAIGIEKTREAIEKYFFEGNVIFTKSCTEALNLGIRGYNPKGKVITTVYEHNSVLRTLKKMENEGKIRMETLLPDKEGFIAPLKRALTKDTSMVVVTARSNVTGKPTDIEEMAKTVKKYSGAVFIMDAAQSAGHDDFNYENIDMVASSGHKGLLGPQGTGFLLCKKNIILTPIITGGTGTSSISLEMPTEVPESLEAGTLNSAGIISLRYGIEYAFGRMEEVNAKIKRLSEYFYERIKNIENIETYSCEGGIVLCNIKGRDSTEISDILSEKYGICVRGGLHCAPLMHRYLGTDKRGALRFSFGNNNNIFHAMAAVSAMKKIARKCE